MEPQNPTIPTPPPQVTPPTVSPVFPKKNNLVVILLSIFLVITLLVSGYLFLQVQSLTKQLIQLQVQPTPTPLSTEIPSPTAKPTSDWKIYTNPDLSFKYPNSWSQDNYVITSVSPKIRLVVTPKDSTLMNECMQEASSQIIGSVFVKKFQRVTTGEMCQTSDSTPREIWVIPSATTYAPGISIGYSSTESQQVEQIVDQILSTFKFTE